MASFSSKICIGLLAVLLFAASPSLACSFRPNTFEVNLSRASIAFIGEMATNDAGLAIFDVQQPIAGVKAGDQFSVEMGQSSCDTRFTPGQVWLYLGPSVPSGSLMLVNEYGVVQEDNAAFAKEKFGYDAYTAPSVQSGKIAESCAPWDGAAFTVSLDNGMSANIYKSLPAEITTPIVFEVGKNKDKPQTTSGSIYICDKDRNNCAQHDGKVFLANRVADTISGQIEISYGEHHSVHVFRVKYAKTQAICG